MIAGIPLTDGFGLYAGLSYRVHLSRAPAEVEMGSPVLEHQLARSGDTLVRGWPSILAGVVT